MEWRNRRMVPYEDAGRGENRGQVPQWVDTNPMITIPPPQPQVGFLPPGVEYADDPVIQEVLREQERRRRTQVPIHPMDLVSDGLKGRR